MTSTDHKDSPSNIKLKSHSQYCTDHVVILDGNLEYDAHAWWKIGLSGEKYPICSFSPSNRMP